MCIGDIPSFTTCKVQIRKVHPITKRDEEDEHYMIDNLDEPMEVILHPNHNLMSGRYARIKMLLIVLVYTHTVYICKNVKMLLAMFVYAYAVESLLFWMSSTYHILEIFTTKKCMLI